MACWAPAEIAAADGVSMGSARAPVTVVEYASVGCPHCATWERTVFPAFKKRFIDTGKVRFEFHEMLTGDPELAAAGFLVADCAPRDRFFQVVNGILDDQVAIANGGSEALFKVAQGAGLTHDQFKACLTNEKALKDLETRTEADAKAHGVNSTPTFIIGSRTLVGDQSLEQLATAIAGAHARGRVRR